VSSRAAQLVLAVACFVFGAMLMVQFRTQGTIAKMVQAESSADQAQIISNLYDANVNLRKEVDTLEHQQQQEETGRGTARVAEVAADLQKFRIVNGSAPAVGSGIELTISADIRPEDVQDLVNELRNAGAEALALNGQRLTARTAVTQDHGAVVVDGRRLAPPFVFEAIGAPDTLDRAMTRKGGLISYLQTTYPEGQFSVEKNERLALAAAPAPPSFQVAQPDKRTG